MSVTIPPALAEQQLTGKAIREIRDRSRMKQRQIAAALGMTTQAWQKYEAGERVWKPDIIATVLRVLGATPEELAFERARILGADPAPDISTGVASPPRAFKLNVYTAAREGEAPENTTPVRQMDFGAFLGPGVDVLEVADDSMYPWAGPGEVVIFDRDRYPRREAGCVVETNAGARHIGLYESSDGSTVFIKRLHPKPSTDAFALKDVRGIYLITLRG